MSEASTTELTVTPKQLGKHLRSVRRKKGLSLSEVADFYVPRCLAVAGLPLRGPDGAGESTGGRTRPRAPRSRTAKR